MAKCICNRSFTQTNFTDDPRLDSLCPVCLETTDVLDEVGIEFEYEAPLTIEDIINNQEQKGLYRYG